MPTYLDAFPLVQTTDPEALRHAVDLLGATHLDFPQGTDGFKGNINFLKLSNIEFAYASYGSALEMAFSEAEYIRQQFVIQGAGATFINGQECKLHRMESCITPSDRPFRFHFDKSYDQVVLRISNEAIQRKLVALTGVTGHLEFEPIVNLEDPRADYLRQLVLFSVHQLEAANGKLPPVLIEEIQQNIIAAFLCCNRNSRSELIDRISKNIAPWQVRRAEEFIVANCDKPITIEMLSDVTGASARSIFQAFRDSRGYSPMAFVKQARLRRSREMLNSTDDETSVTGVAYACGFLNLGHFANDYHEMFGELPSETLKRSRSVYVKKSD